MSAGFLVGAIAGVLVGLGLTVLARNRSRATLGPVDVLGWEKKRDEKKEVEKKTKKRKHVIRVTWFDDEFAVCKLKSGQRAAGVASWQVVAEAACGENQNKPPVFAALTSSECSLVLPAMWVPKVSKVGDFTVDAGWRCFVVEGPMPFDLVGIMAKLSSCLADAGVSILAQSTFDTDYVLVKADKVDEAAAALRGVGVVVE